jgi:hypothetical protein
VEQGILARRRIITTVIVTLTCMFPLIILLMTMKSQSMTLYQVRKKNQDIQQNARKYAQKYDGVWFVIVFDGVFAISMYEYD